MKFGFPWMNLAPIRTKSPSTVSPWSLAINSSATLLEVRIRLDNGGRETHIVRPPQRLHPSPSLALINPHQPFVYHRPASYELTFIILDYHLNHVSMISSKKPTSILIFMKPVRGACQFLQPADRSPLPGGTHSCFHSFKKNHGSLHYP